MTQNFTANIFSKLNFFRFDSIMDILKEFYSLRLTMYQKRKDYLEGMLAAEAQKLSNQARFITEKCNMTLTVENKKRKVIVEELLKRGYEPDPVKAWKKRTQSDEEKESEEEVDTEEFNEAPSSSKKLADAGISNIFWLYLVYYLFWFF